MSNQNLHSPHNSKILLIDGVCNLCIGLVQFILRNEKNQEIKFANIQDSIGRECLIKYDIDPADLSSVVYLKDQKIFRFSDAILEIFKELKSPWCLLSIFKLIPRPIRDFIYRMIAKRRYQIFGKRETCFLPTPETDTRFLK